MLRKNNVRRVFVAALAILAIAAAGPSTASAGGSKIKPACEVTGGGCYG